MSLEKLYSGNGINIFNIKEDRFKTNSISVFFVDKLSRSTVSTNALMVSVLNRGTNKYKETLDLERRKAELYGLRLDCEGNKHGDLYIMSFQVDVIDDKFTLGKKSLIEEAFGFIRDVLLDPYIKDGKFEQKYVDTEKSNLIKMIEATINEKSEYATCRFLENMFKDEPFGVNNRGYVEDYAKITNEDLVKNYHRMISSMPMYIFVAGNVDNDMIMKSTECFRNLKRDKIISVENTLVKKQVDKVNVVVDKMEVIQDKYIMGFRTNVDNDTKDYVSALVYNKILGGGLSSKLFKNVREKNSLCYYIFSMLDRTKGLMMISTGIEGKNRDIVRQMIMKELNNMKKGDITDFEIETAKKSIRNSYEATRDTQYGIIGVELRKELFGYKLGIEEILEMLDSVTKEDIMKVSENIVLDTEYVLTTNK
ncbi:MAG: insulinase family protein [Clostridiales bacterium]|nr:insulinase family protein [Clostridiales bacterium]